MKKIIRKIILLIMVIGLLIAIIFGTVWMVKKFTKKEADNSHNSDSPSPPQNPNKTEIKITWGGWNLTNLDYYAYIDSEKYNKKGSMPEEYYYYIRKNHPSLAGKRLNQDGLVLTLSFDEKEVVKRKVKENFDKNSPQFGFGGTFLESGFSLTPNIPWEDWPGGFENYKTQQVEFVNAVLRDGNAIFKHGDPKKDTKFIVNVDNPVIQKLRNENNLIIGKLYLINFSQETEYKKINDDSDFYYFDAKNKSLDIHSAIGSE